MTAASSAQPCSIFAAILLHCDCNFNSDFAMTVARKEGGEGGGVSVPAVDSKMLYGSHALSTGNLLGIPGTVTVTEPRRISLATSIKQSDRCNLRM